MLTAPLRRNLERGFTLIELVLVIIILGVLASTAIPKFFDFSVDAKISACRGSLGNMRGSINGFRLEGAVDGALAWPTLAQLKTPGTVIKNIPQNPFSTPASSGGCVAATTKTDILAGTTAGVPVTSGTTGAWCYKAATGEIWADTASGNGEAAF